VAINLGNIWRALPSRRAGVGVAFLGVGLRNVELALIVLAIPPMITNAYVPSRRRPGDRRRSPGNGADRLADPAPGRGPDGDSADLRRIRTASLFVISTTTIASLTGYSGTLGDIINNERAITCTGSSAPPSASPHWR